MNRSKVYNNKTCGLSALDLAHAHAFVLKLVISLLTNNAEHRYTKYYCYCIYIAFQNSYVTFISYNSCTLAHCDLEVFKTISLTGVNDHQFFNEGFLRHQALFS